MTTVADVHQFINQFAPPDLAEDWDNTGLLVGDPAAAAQHIMTCLTVTPESAAEAVERGAQLVVTHHPIPFRPLQRITTDDVTGRLLLQLIEAKIAVISPHTAFDSAASGINSMLAAKLELVDARPLIPADERDPSRGAARIARAPGAGSLGDLLQTARSAFDLSVLRYVGDPGQAAEWVGLACGSGGSFLEPAIAASCQCLVTGEATFHTCLAARAAGVALVLLGHHTSERFAVESLSEILAGQFPGATVWSSEQESDPIRYA